MFIIKALANTKCFTVCQEDRANQELQITQQTVWKILQKWLKMIPYLVKLLKSLSDQNKTTSPPEYDITLHLIVRLQF